VPVKLRLVRMGKKKQPTYRLVAADSRSPRDGRFLEVLGTYEPRGASRAAPETVLKVNNDRAVQWLHQGAQPTERVEKLLKASGAWATFKGSAEPAPAAPPAPSAQSPSAPAAPAEDAPEMTTPAEAVSAEA
jgi:small subunit ribosomal protein S16